MEQAMMEAIRWITRGIEIIGIAVIVIGAATALVAFLRELGAKRDKAARISDLRSDLGRSILLGLEFLVAADIVNTVAIHPTLDSLAILAGIVLIRTFLSFALEVEIEGRWPWQGRAGTAQQTPGG
jgi:uncharacterized membrane protein